MQGEFERDDLIRQISYEKYRYDRHEHDFEYHALEYPWRIMARPENSLEDSSAELSRTSYPERQRFEDHHESGEDDSCAERYKDHFGDEEQRDALYEKQ